MISTSDDGVFALQMSEEWFQGDAVLLGEEDSYSSEADVSAAMLSS